MNKLCMVNRGHYMSPLSLIMVTYEQSDISNLFKELPNHGPNSVRRVYLLNVALYQSISGPICHSLCRDNLPLIS